MNTKICLFFASLSLTTAAAFADTSVPRPNGNLTGVDKKAFAIAKATAAAIGAKVDARCLGMNNETSYDNLYGTKHEGSAEHPLSVYNIAFGNYDSENQDCPDPHYSLDMVFDSEGKFLSSVINDI